MKIVIKFAGALLEDDATVRSLAHQVAALAKDGQSDIWWCMGAAACLPRR